MNKLVTKNPVQRFKNGKKIIKAQGGTNRIILGYESPKKDNDFSLVTSARYLGYNPPGFNGNMMYNLPNLDSTNTQIDNKSQTASENNLQTELKQENPQVLQEKSNSQKTNRGISFKQAFNKARKSGLQEFTCGGKRFNTKNKGEENYIFQNGKWIAPPIQKITLSLPKLTISPINQEVTDLNLNVPQQIYDRAGIRQFIKDKGLNPYSFTGAQRRALRMVINGRGTDNDKLLVKGMGLFKQGGQLVSRNSVGRFKQNKNFI